MEEIVFEAAFALASLFLIIAGLMSMVPDRL